MESTNSQSSNKIFQIILFILGLIGLYYLYQYLFGTKTSNVYTLISATKSADIASTVSSDKLPPLFEGGEFSISTWIYINNWSYNIGKGKSIISIGPQLSPTSYDIIRIYLGRHQPKLHVRLHTSKEKLDSTSNDNIFTNGTDSELLDSPQICDLPEVELQKWINITVAVNGRTVDVYLNGKLARSCVLESIFKVSNGYSAKLCSPGFGGKISTTTMYDSALNPEQVYKQYMAGPEPIGGIFQWISSFFEPKL